VKGTPPKPWAPDRGEAVWLDFEPHAGHEQSGRRPAVVLSAIRYNGKVGLAMMCPVTSQMKGYPWEVLLPAGLAVSGVVLADQARSVDWRSRRAERICRLPPGVVESVVEKVQALIEP
jgi:mRNA interferase MazF